MNALFVVEDVVGKNMILATNNLRSNVFKPTGTVVAFREDGKAEFTTGTTKISGRWELLRDGLMLTERGQPLVFDSKETRNGTVYAVCRGLDDSQDRVILFEQKLLDLNRLGVCVSSHTRFVGTAIPRLMKSLSNTPFSLSRAVIVVGDSKIPNVSTHKSGAKLVETQKNLLGFTAFSEADELRGSDYWLLLHDTCEVLPDFPQQLSGIDVGLNPDIITFVGAKERLEIGIYANSFVQTARIGEMHGKSYEHMNEVHKRANIILDLREALKRLPPKDIYGEGIKRETVTIPSLGVRKFRGESISGGRP